MITPLSLYEWHCHFGTSARDFLLNVKYEAWHMAAMAMVPFVQLCDQGRPAVSSRARKEEESTPGFLPEVSDAQWRAVRPTLGTGHATSKSMIDAGAGLTIA
jgi:hypothetical protein